MLMLVDIDWDDLDCTEQARENLDRILDEVGYERWESYLYDRYSDPISADEVADDLHHEWEEIFSDLGISDEDDEDDEDEIEDDEDEDEEAT